MKYSYILIIMVSLIVVGCKNNVHHIYSPDKNHCITVIDDYEYRYIIDGNHTSLPHDNYIKLYIADRLPMDDEWAGCWETNGYQWEVTIDNSVIVENKLDTLKFRFHKNLPKGRHNLPSLNQFNGNGCYHFGFGGFSVVPNNGAIIE